jgi:hypothetical protein
MTLMEAVNGHVKGRAIPALPTFTFKDSGITVQLRKLSPMTQQRLSEAVRREYPPPEPPVTTVEYGDTAVEEPNEADPTYLARYQRWQQETAKVFNERLLKLVCMDAVEVDLDDAARQQIARKMRSFTRTGIPWEDDPDLDAEENLRLFYVQHICLGSTEDMREFYQAVTARSQPTEAAVQAHIDTFPGDVPG